jgi:hypothetical protein
MTMRWSPYGLIVTVLLAACDGGSDPGDRTDAGDRADAGPLADAAPRTDAPAASELRGELRVLEVRDGHGDGNGGPITEYASGRADGRLYDGAPPRWQKLVRTDGACELWSYQPAFCDEPCSGVCVDTNDCRPFPSPRFAGTLQASGLRVPVTFLYDPYVGYYPDTNAPADLFDDEAAVRLAASGDVVPAFELTARGVAPLAAAITDHVITLAPHQPHTFTWTPGPDSAARVHVTLNANNQGHGNPYEAIIECDAADADGSLVVSAAIVDAFPATENWFLCVGSDCPRSTILRYRDAFARVGEGVVRLLVGSEIAFGVEHRP